MANWLDYILSPFKAMFGRTNERGDALEHSHAQQRRLQEQRYRDRRAISSDHAASIPRLEDVFHGLIHDTDPLLEEVGPEAYDRIYNDWQIVRNLDNLGLTVAASKFAFASSQDKDSAALIPHISRLTLAAPGFKALVRHLAKKAPVENVAIVGHTWKPTMFRTDKGLRHGFLPKKFTLKDKSRFAPARTDWSRMYLVDDGFNRDVAALNTRTGRQFEVDRRHYIVGIWDDIEDALGWGRGLGVLLYRLAYIRDRVLHILARAVESHGGGVRWATKDLNLAAMAAEFGNETSESGIDSSINDALTRMGSFDAAVFPPGVKPEVVFPPPGSIEALIRVVKDYFDGEISQLVNGTDITASGKSGSSGQSKARVLSQNERIRKQYIADWVCEVLQREFVERAAEYNQWIYEAAGVPIDTPLPILSARVPGGHDRLENAQILATVQTLSLPILKTEAYDELGFSQPTERQIEDGEVVEFAQPPSPIDPLSPEGVEATSKIEAAKSKGDPMNGTKDGMDRDGDSPFKKQEDRNSSGNARKAVGK